MQKSPFFHFFCIAVLSVILQLGVQAVRAADYYVSPNGNDANDGLSEKSAWQTLTKVKCTVFNPGDRVLFERGGIWRSPNHSAAVWGGMIIPCSGEPGKPVTYSAYGTGEKPTFYGSVSASDEADWVEVSPRIWGTREVTRTNGDTLEMNLTSWSLHHEGGTDVRLNPEKQEDGTVILTVRTQKSGTADHHIQLWGDGPILEKMTRTFIVRFRARCSVPFEMKPFEVYQSGFPYHTKCRPVSGTTALSEEWREFETLLYTSDADEGTSFKWHLRLGMMPADCELQIQPLEVRECCVDDRLALTTDVGNIIFNHGNFTKYHRCGIKKWKIEDLKAPGDYFYDASTSRVFLYWDENPAKTCESIELAMKSLIINHSGKHDVIFDGLGLCYGASHGFGGSNAKRIVVRNCDIYYIGGAHQFTREDGWPVRFGNGIEYWGTASDCLIENNRLWEIYDAALTNQGRGSEKDPSNEVGITYRGNEIWNSEYSFEYWNSGGVTQNILFENNVCRDAGYGWAHGQRPDPNGAHLMFYNNKAETSNFVVRKNVFSNSTEVCIRMQNDWCDALTLEKNTYSQTPGMKIIRYENNKYYDSETFSQYQSDLGMDVGSRVTESEK